jgi:hypothetical protein
MPQGRLLVTMLAAIAEFERELIRERTGEGASGRLLRAYVSAVSPSSQTSSGTKPQPAAATARRWRRNLLMAAVRAAYRFTLVPDGQYSNHYRVHVGPNTETHIDSFNRTHGREVEEIYPSA